MMEIDQCKKKNKIKRKMKCDDIGEILGLTKYIPLHEGERKYDDWSPSSESEFVEKRSK